MVEQDIAAVHIVQETMITNPKQFDGFGSQFQTIIASAIYAELNNKKFVYTPFQVMDHNYNNDPNFIAQKELLINFIFNFETIDEIDRNKNDIVSLEIADYRAFFNANIVQCANSHSLKKIKEVFRANKNTHNYFNNNNLNIAIHIRRPNQHDVYITGANISDNFFLTIINRLRIIYSSKNPLFHLYSQGSIEHFKVFNSHDIILHINESIEDTFISMVLADILVTSPSSFSYSAALLSENCVYYMPFWHLPFPHWITIEKLLNHAK